MCRPSLTLQKLIPGLDESAIISNEDRITLDLLRRPSISFILRRHPIFALRFAMKHSIRKATCRYLVFLLVTFEKSIDSIFFELILLFYSGYMLFKLSIGF